MAHDWRIELDVLPNYGNYVYIRQAPTLEQATNEAGKIIRERHKGEGRIIEVSKLQPFN